MNRIICLTLITITGFIFSACTNNSNNTQSNNTKCSEKVCESIIYTGIDPDNNRYEEIQYRWGKLTITISTDAGYYSEYLKNSQSNILNKNQEDTFKDITENILTYFVFTSAVASRESSPQMVFKIPEMIQRFGQGHSLPIIWAVAFENIQRPLPTLFGEKITTYTVNLDETKGGFISPDKEGVLRIIVDTDYSVFKRYASTSGYPFSEAFYNPKLNEIRLYLDMERFKKYYGFLENQQGAEGTIAFAFISYVETVFNDNSGHEITHFYQSQSKDAAYQIPAIAEGEALVQGFTRRRDGLDATLIYDLIEMSDIHKSLPILEKRIENMIQMGGRPFSPFEVDRLVELKNWIGEQSLIPIDKLLLMDWGEFYSGSKEEVKKRYLEAWVISLMAIRDQEVELMLRQVIQDIGNKKALDRKTVETIQNDMNIFITWNLRPVVDKTESWDLVEAIYQQDHKLGGIGYQQIYQSDPTDYMALVCLGDILFASYRFDTAFYYYEKAHNIAPDAFIPLTRMGDVYFSIKDYEEAKQIYLLALDKKIETDNDKIIEVIIRGILDKMNASSK